MFLPCTRAHTVIIIIIIKGREDVLRGVGVSVASALAIGCLSINGTKIREDLSVDKIVNQWMELIE